MSRKMVISKMNRTEIGTRIRAIREELGLSLNKASHMAFVSLTQLKGIEEGNNNPTLDTLLKIAESWGVHISEFFLDSKGKTKRKRDTRD
jgi:transcriptional regulator with XRE-family HTH domain